MTLTPNAKQIPIKIVGSSVFGRYPIINTERTYNMFISDDWLISFAGYLEALEINSDPSIQGRGLFHSTRGNFLILVIGDRVWRINPGLGFQDTGLVLATTSGEVFMDENLSSQICIVDGVNAYIYNYYPPGLGSGVVTLPFNPGYVTYQNTFFIFGNADTTVEGSKWFVYKSGFMPPATNPLDLTYVSELELQTKPDFAKACVRVPGHGNTLLVLGSIVGEIWTNVGGAQNYQRNATINIDYGAASVSTIASMDDMVAWLGINEKSAPAIMVMKGGQAQRISTDGIDYLLSNVVRPDQSTAMFYRQDGHVFYILTFYDIEDNFSIAYDFTTDKFFDLTDWDFTHFPARQVAYFDSQIYFASLKQGSLMLMDSDITDMSTGDGIQYQIPRMRICGTFRLPGGERFIANALQFTVENGVETGVYEGGSYQPRIDVKMSKNGGETYSNTLSYYMHPTGHYKNQPRFNQLGEANQLTFQFRFWGLGRFAIWDGLVELRQ